MKNIYKIINKESLLDIFSKYQHNLIVILHVEKDVKDEFKRQFIKLSKENEECIFLYIDSSQYADSLSINSYPVLIFYLNGKILLTLGPDKGETSINIKTFIQLFNRVKLAVKSKQKKMEEEETRQEDYEKKEEIIRKLKEIQKLEELKHLEKIKTLKEKNEQ